jgi:hypothetical protein
MIRGLLEQLLIAELINNSVILAEVCEILILRFKS